MHLLICISFINCKKNTYYIDNKSTYILSVLNAIIVLYALIIFYLINLIGNRYWYSIISTFIRYFLKYILFTTTCFVVTIMSR